MGCVLISWFHKPDTFCVPVPRLHGYGASIFPLSQCLSVSVLAPGTFVYGVRIPPTDPDAPTHKEFDRKGERHGRPDVALEAVDRGRAIPLRRGRHGVSVDLLRALVDRRVRERGRLVALDDEVPPGRLPARLAAGERDRFYMPDAPGWLSLVPMTKRYRLPVMVVIGAVGLAPRLPRMLATGQPMLERCPEAAVESEVAPSHHRAGVRLASLINHFDGRSVQDLFACEGFPKKGEWGVGWILELHQGFVGWLLPVFPLAMAAAVFVLTFTAVLTHPLSIEARQRGRALACCVEEEKEKEILTYLSQGIFL